MKKLIILLATLILATPAFAQSNNTGLLFEIKGKSLTKPSYIFGTFHVVCQQDMLPLEKIKSLIDAGDETIMEIDLDDPAELQSMVAGTQISTGKTLADYLTPEQYKRVDEAYRTYLGASVETVKTMKPSLIGIRMLTSPKAIGCEKPSSYDLTILQTSMADKKPIIGLETVAFQSKALEAKPIEKQAEDLYKSSLQPEKYISDFKSLIDVYRQQDVDKLYEFTAKQMANDHEFATSIIDDRNKTWIPKIEKLITEKPSFIAVGAGHLGGKNGVLNLLRNDGYTVTAVHL